METRTRNTTIDYLPLLFHYQGTLLEIYQRGHKVILQHMLQKEICFHGSSVTKPFDFNDLQIYAVLQILLTNAST